MNITRILNWELLKNSALTTPQSIALSRGRGLKQSEIFGIEETYRSIALSRGRGLKHLRNR